MTDLIEGVAETTETVVEAQVEATETPEVDVTTEAPEEKTEEQKLKDDLEFARKKIQRQRKANAALQAQAARAKHLEVEIEKLKQATPQKEPKIDDFETTDEFLDAKAEHLADQKANKRLQETLEVQKQALANQSLQERDREFQKAEIAYMQTSPSYNDAKSEVRSFVVEMGVDPASPVMNAIYEQADSENNLPQIIDYFGKNGGQNLGELEYILSLSPVRAAVEIAKIQLKLKPQQTNTTPLPKPIKPVTGGARASKSVDDMSGEELLKKFKVRY